MSSDPDVVSCGRSSAVEAAVQQTTALWAADDVDRVIAAARTLLNELVPGVRVRYCPPGVGAQDTGDKRHRFQIDLPRGGALCIDAPHATATGTLHTLIDTLRTRVDVLGKWTILNESVDRLARAERLQRALYAITEQASAAGADLTTTLRTLHGIVGGLTYAKNFYIALYDPEHDCVRFPYYADTVDPNPPGPDRDFPMAEILHGPTWYVIHDGKPLMGSLEQLRDQVNGPFRGSGAECVDWLGVPLRHGDAVAGCVVIQSYDAAHRYTQQDQALLTYVSQHVATALERCIAHSALEQLVAERTEALRAANRDLQQQVLVRQRNEQLQAALFQIARLAATSCQIDDFYRAVHRVVGSLLYARNFYIALLADDGATLTFPYMVDERDARPQPRKLGRGLTEYVLRHGATLLADSTQVGRLCASGEVVLTGNTDTVWWLGVPLIRAERTIGVIAVQSYSALHCCTPRDQELLTFVSYHIANALELVRATESLHAAYAELENRVEARTRDLALANRDLRAQISERERVEARLKHQALHDVLTGLPNRTQLLEHLQRSLERFHHEPAKGFAVLFIDLDRFKIVNDSVGHLTGDDMLFQAGGRLRACVKPEDVVARLGGDEFGVLLDDVSEPDTASRVAQRIIDAFNAPFRVGTKDLFTSASVGIALSAQHYQHPEELLRDADSAMYRAKAEGRHCWRLFDQSLRRHALSLMEIENDLRRAHTQAEFVPYYQPIVELADGHVVGYEALMRWLHPRRGVLLPAEFLDVAEDSGIAEAIDWQIFEQVCRDAPTLLDTANTSVAINLSARHFRDPELDRRLLGMLATHNVPSARIRIEVTERAMLENPPEAKRILQTLRGAGIAISLDDFGTGYSSLSYLHQYPVQTIKIDRSFITSLTSDSSRGSEAIIRTIIAMARLLSMQVIAEGVETMEQRNQLVHMGCHFAQGFLYGKARPLRDQSHQERTAKVVDIASRALQRSA